MDTLFFGLFSGACAASLWLLLAKSFPRRPALEQLGHAIALGLMFVFALTVSRRRHFPNFAKHGYTHNAIVPGTGRRRKPTWICCQCRRSHRNDARRDRHPGLALALGDEDDNPIRTDRARRRIHGNIFI